MLATRLQFELPKNSRPIDLIDDLTTETKFVRDRDLEFTRYFLDTFDWRLFNQGFLLVCDFLNGAIRTTWQSCETAEILGVMLSEKVPEFVDDFPTGRIQRILEPILEMRALLAQSKLQCQQHRLHLKNKQNKIVLRLSIESCATEDRNGDTKKLSSRVYLDPVRGYDKAFSEVSALLKERLDLQPPANNLLVSALSRVGRYPRDYTSKFDLRLEPSMRADSAIRIILRQLFSTLERNEDGTLNDTDSEFLHDFRVAVRRTRALLGQSHDILSEDTLKLFTREFAWLNRVTGPTRDLDVYLLNLSGYKNQLPVSIRDDLEPLAEFLKNKQKMAHSELVKELKSKRYAELKREWKKVLAKSIAESPKEILAARRVTQVADAKITTVSKQIRKKGQLITSETPAARLHRLRIHCKKLRYLIEFFGSLYPEKQIRRLIKSLKTLQDNLGTFQDLEVQEKALKEYSTEMMESKNPARTLLAIGVLVQELEKKREAVRAEFMQRYADFDSADNRKLFQSLFDREEEDRKG